MGPGTAIRVNVYLTSSLACYIPQSVDVKSHLPHGRINRIDSLCPYVSLFAVTRIWSLSSTNCVFRAEASRNAS